VIAHGQPAGAGTATHATAQGRYLPLKTAQNVIGVLGVSFRKPLPPERNRLLEAFASQAGLAIDAIYLAEKARQTQLLKEKEKLQTALLNSISHDFRTPLVSITGALSSLRDQAHLLNEEARNDLLDTAWEEAERLNHLVGNLLDMTRLEANAIRLKKTPYDVQEIIGAALAQMKHRLATHEVVVNLPPGLPLIDADFMLLVQVLTNLLDNAAKYSSEHTRIEICAEQNDQVKIMVADQGMGIKESELQRIFEKFYRAEGSGIAGGTGLGLSICQGIVEAHGGRVWAQNRPEGGALFTFTMPIAELRNEL